MPPLSELQTRLRHSALNLGFCGLGFSPLLPSPYQSYLEQWLHTRKYGQMEYLARNFEQRLNPKSRFPWAQSALLFAFPYNPNPPSSPLSPFIARYAKGIDYHSLLERKLEQIVKELLVSFPNTQTRIYVDTGPLFERELAQQAGLGFIGKNTLLIHRHHGSYFLLATLLTSLPFSPDQTPDTSHCGTCTRCLDICPTQALTPYQMDATKCISYLTIEKKGELSDKEMDGIGPYYFGCDLCQEVCPFNRRPFPFGEELGHSHPLTTLQWDQLVSLEEETFERLKPKSPLRRAKYAGILRNLFIVLGNLKWTPYWEKIKKHQDSPLPGVASAVRFARKKFFPDPPKQKTEKEE